MLSKRGYEKLLRGIFDTGGVTPDMADALKKLKDDFDEREGMLRRFGEVYDGEDDEYEYRPREVDDWETRYNDLKKDYIDRFFGTSTVKERYEDVMEETAEDVKRDGTVQSFDELWERREG